MCLRERKCQLPRRKGRASWEKTHSAAHKVVLCGVLPGLSLVPGRPLICCTPRNFVARKIIPIVINMRGDWLSQQPSSIPCPPILYYILSAIYVITIFSFFLLVSPLCDESVRIPQLAVSIGCLQLFFPGESLSVCVVLRLPVACQDVCQHTKQHVKQMM